jgi:isopentenyl diphosphate isomerase/L-lactate dehydrogenase-like FMN-dependent dehydrogenase
MGHVMTAEKGTIPSGEGGLSATTLDEVYELGRDALPDGIQAYLEEGAGEEQTLIDNRRAFSRWSVRPRQMTGVVEPDLTATLLGIQMAAPILTAPIGADGLFHKEDGRAIVQAASEYGLVPIVAEASTRTMEEYAAVNSSPKLMQVHAWGTLRQFYQSARRIEDSGYSGICITVDCPTLGWRERTLRERFKMQADVCSGNRLTDGTGIDPHHLLTSGRGSEWVWDTLAKARASTSLPLLVKGILTGDDARRAVDAGADGVVVSNHGGRQLDGVPATLDQLSEVVDALGPGATVLLDGGIRRGLDVLKALACGARAVLIGRTVALGLAAGGRAGVSTVLRLMIQELHRSMLLSGVSSLSGLDDTILQPRVVA